MSAVTKDVLYVDVDDEITSLIDRLGTSEHKVVALVLPKKATVLQSIVNMKLLKRAADENNKHVVLVTTESGLMPLAGAVGLHVAATPNSKPVVPHKPAGMKEDTEDSELTEEDFDPKASAAAPIGTLAGDADKEETIQLDNEPEPSPVVAAAKSAKQKATKPKKGKDKKLKVPDFNAFRKKWLLIGGAVAALIVFWVLGFMVLPKATIAVKTDSEDINKRLDITFSTTAAGVNVDEDIVPSVVEQTQKVATQSVQASGQENRGQKASGSVRLVNCSDDPVIIAPGTGISSGDLTYITQSAVKLNEGDFTSGGTCKQNGGHVGTTDVVAVAAGAKYNLNKGATMSSGRSSVSATASSDFSGGTDNIIKTVTASDIESVRQKLSSQVDNAVQEELAAKLEDRDLFVIRDSFNTGTPEVTVSAKVGDQVDSVNATQKTTYSMVGVKKKDIESLITKKVEADIDTQKQRVLNTGVDKATFKLQNQQNNSAQVQMSMDVTALAGPRLDDEKIKKEIAGKKAGEVREILKNYPGVTDVEVSMSPFWVKSVPKSASKVTITYEK